MTTPTSEKSCYEVKEESVEDDNESCEKNESCDPACQPAEIEAEAPRGVITSTRKEQADEEYNLIKNLSQSIAEKHKRQKSATCKEKDDNTLEAFGKYVT